MMGDIICAESFKCINILSFIFSNIAAWGNLANVLNQQGKKHEAEDAYRNALKHRGNMADTHYNL